MAPGGFSATVLKYNESAQIHGLSLPDKDGGHGILLPGWEEDPRVEVQLLDVTMLAAEFGYPYLIHPRHPSASLLPNSYRPYA